MIQSSVQRFNPRIYLARPLVLIASTTIALIAGSVLADDPYARVTETNVGPDNGLVTLEMCERAFAPISGQGPKIHLIAAIHIADASFYESMQTLLESYDRVLFEGVKPAGLDAIDMQLGDQAKHDATEDRLALLIDIADGFHSSNARLPKSFDDLIEHSDPRMGSLVGSITTDGWAQPITLALETLRINDEPPVEHITFTSTGADFIPGGDGLDSDIVRSTRTYSPNDPRKPAPIGIQTRMADALHVDFQLDSMDMTGKGWVNADMDINELQLQLSELGEDNAMILQLIEGESFGVKLIGFVLKFVERSPTMSSMMKLAMMDMLALIETTNMLAQFEAIEQVILHGRNEVVIDYLRADLESHPDANDIAIFYGAAHMPGLEEVILAEMGYEFESNTWAQAMSVNTADTGLTPGQIKMMRNMIKKSLENQF